MALKYVPRDVNANFDEGDVHLVFRRPTKKEIVARQIKDGRRYLHALADSTAPVKPGDKPEKILDFNLMTREEIAEMMTSDMSMAAELLLSVEGVEGSEGVAIDLSKMDLAAKIQFLEWMDDQSKLFSDFIEKLVTTQKKT